MRQQRSRQAENIRRGYLFHPHQGRNAVEFFQSLDHMLQRPGAVWRKEMIRLNENRRVIIGDAERIHIRHFDLISAAGIRPGDTLRFFLDIRWVQPVGNHARREVTQ